MENQAKVVKYLNNLILVMCDIQNMNINDGDMI